MTSQTKDSKTFMTRIRGRAAVPAVALALLAGGTTTAYALRDDATAASVIQMRAPGIPASFADVVAQTSGAVVTITTMGKSEPSTSGRYPSIPKGHPFGEQFKRFFDRQNGQPREVRGLGSGFIVDSSGLVVTNHHVIKGADKIMVTLHDGRRLPATVKGVDDRTDLALLEIESDTPLEAVRFADSDAARTGDWVVAVGNPFGLGGSYTAGIISARGRDIGSSPEDDFLQIDAPINQGNSGGALFNVRGEVVGVNTAIFSPNGGNVGIGFAVPANIAQRVVGQLKSHGAVARGWLGVRLQALTPELAEGLGIEGSKGALVASVEPNGPAANAGLRPGDVISAVDSDATESARDLARQIARRSKGDEVALQVWREGKSVSVLATLEKLANAEEAPVSSAPDQGLGLTLAPLTPELARRFGHSDSSAGALIVEVAEGSLAARGNLTPGMLIVGVGTTATPTPESVATELRQARAADSNRVVLRIEDPEGRTGFVAVPLA
jgi:serine protease Do